MSVYAISGITQVAAAVEGPAAGPKGQSFLDSMREAVEKVNELQQASGAEVRRLITGETEDLHKTLLAVQRAELAFELMMEVRNKVVQAYQEIMRIQV